MRTVCWSMEPVYSELVCRRWVARSCCQTQCGVVQRIRFQRPLLKRAGAWQSGLSRPDSTSLSHVWVSDVAPSPAPRPNGQSWGRGPLHQQQTRLFEKVRASTRGASESLGPARRQGARNSSPTPFSLSRGRLEAAPLHPSDHMPVDGNHKMHRAAYNAQ